ncbi:MAG TPA: c-type cytochrome biogenesis protein CcmI [Ramlibacter sp.]|nr:c-type cytochrome biogenesis protein CcmI [Ramlibacter sp.]
MTAFVACAVLSIAVVLALLLRPFLRNPAASGGISHRQLNAAIYREQIARLDQDQAEGLLREEDHTQARAELQRRLLEETQEPQSASRLHAPRRTVVALSLLLPVAAAGLYAAIGNPAGLVAPADANQDVERMVSGLAEKLQKDPSNVKGWAMLARSYKVMGRMAQAEQAFERAGAYIDGDAQALADYADVAASNAGGRFAGKPAQLIDKALKADPNHPMALWLAGTAALDAQDYARAVRIWEGLAAQLKPGSDDERMLRGAIAEVRERAGVAAAAATPGRGAAAAAGAGSVSGTVDLAPSLKDRAAPGDTVMVIARPPGSRMPLAVLRVPASQLPLTFTLDDSLAMSPQARISTAAQVEVEARISRTGVAQAASGDLISQVQTVHVGAVGVKLRVERIRP